MGSPLYSIPGTAPATTPVAEPTADAAAAQASPSTEARTVSEVLAQSQAGAVMDDLDRDLVGLTPIKARIRDIAALLVIDKLRMNLGLSAQAPSLHMSFTGNPGTGKTTVALRMAEILHRLGYVRKGHLVSVTRDDLVGQYIGHTAPKTKEVLKRAMGGVLFIDEAYYLYRPENERDYGQEAIEILLQVMENHREDLVVILAGYKDRMDTFFTSNPGMSSRIAHHIDFPDYTLDELSAIGDLILAPRLAESTPAPRTPATSTGRCGACPTSTSTTSRRWSARSTGAGRSSPTTTSASAPPTPASAARRRRCPSSSTARRSNRSSASSGPRAPAA